MTVLLTLLYFLTPPSFWVERKGPDLHARAQLHALFDSALRRQLSSGLTSTLHLRLEVRRHPDGEQVGGTWRLVRARWDLWDEQITAIIDSPKGSRTEMYPSVDAFVQSFAQIEGTVALRIPNDDKVYRLSALLEVNPLSPSQLARMRRWLASPDAGTALDPLGSGLMGSFVHLFDNLKAGHAERTIRAQGHPFRGDRLPFWKPSEPPATPPAPQEDPHGPT